jgi:hypothetical protein
MPSTRSKLVLDEESFQGLLAAAFTIQQYNDREGGIDRALSAELTETAKTNRKHGSAGMSAVSTLSPEDGSSSSGFRDEGRDRVQDKVQEDVQRKKASINDGTALSTDVALCSQCGAPLLAPGIPCSACDAEILRPGERLQRTWATMWSLSQEQGTFPGPAGAASSSRAGAGALPAPTNLGVATEKDLAGLAVARAGSESEAELAALSADAVATTSTLPGPRLKLRFHRADLYLGLAVLVAFFALLWPTASTGRSELTPWERMLVAVGIAEAPTQAEVHYSGDPDIKVWVDTQAALYYCPGDELYGKSAGGHYTTQHEAQLDRFEPALRRACVP